MVQGFPSAGTRLCLLRDVGSVSAGTIVLVTYCMRADDDETPADVFVVHLESNKRTLWAFRRNLVLAA